LAVFWRYLQSLGLTDILLAVLDIGVVAFVVYKFMMIVKGTRAVQLIKGLAVLVVVSIVADRLHLTTINWILSQLRLVIIVALPIVFQPELRRALEQIGRGKFLSRSIKVLGTEEMAKLINEVVRAIQVLAKNRTGALVVIERETGLNDYLETGIRLDGVVSAELLTNIFVPLIFAPQAIRPGYRLFLPTG
jgi:diadenylate cyclase